LTPTVSDHLSSVIITPSTFASTDFPFSDQENHSVTVTLPLHPSQIELQLRDNLLINMPFIQRTLPSSPLFHHIPSHLHHNHFILSINAECPITASYAIKILKHLQSSSDRQVTFILACRGPADTSISLQISHAMFDNLPAMITNKLIINSLASGVSPVIGSLHVPSTHDHYVTAPRKPSVPKSFYDALKSPFRFNWKAAAWVQFQKKSKDCSLLSSCFEIISSP
jgi:hypothetical protein